MLSRLGIILKTKQNKSRTIPITRPDKRWTPPLRSLLLIPRRPNRSLADPKRPPAVDAGFLCREADTWFLVALAVRRWFLAEQPGPIFFAGDLVDHKLSVLRR